jgi:hypothetical protein
MLPGVDELLYKQEETGVLNQGLIGSVTPL